MNYNSDKTFNLSYSIQDNIYSITKLTSSVVVASILWVEYDVEKTNPDIVFPTDNYHNSSVLFVDKHYHNSPH